MFSCVVWNTCKRSQDCLIWSRVRVDSCVCVYVVLCGLDRTETTNSKPHWLFFCGVACHPTDRVSKPPRLPAPDLSSPPLRRSSALSSTPGSTTTQGAMAQQHADPPAVPPPPEPPDNPAPLFSAIRADDVRQLERALSKGASIDGAAAVEAEDGLPPEYSTGAVTALMLVAFVAAGQDTADSVREREEDEEDRAASTMPYISWLDAKLNSTNAIPTTSAIPGDFSSPTPMACDRACCRQAQGCCNEHDVLPTVRHADGGIGGGDSDDVVEELSLLRLPLQLASDSFIALVAFTVILLSLIYSVVSCKGNRLERKVTSDGDTREPAPSALKTGRVLAELGACVKTPKNGGATPVYVWTGGANGDGGGGEKKTRAGKKGRRGRK